MQVFPYAVAETKRTCMVASDDHFNVGDGHLICDERQMKQYEASMVARGAVHSVRLDEYLAGSPPVDVIKVDVEGYEPQAMAGAGLILISSWSFFNFRTPFTHFLPYVLGRTATPPRSTCASPSLPFSTGCFVQSNR